VYTKGQIIEVDTSIVAASPLPSGVFADAEVLEDNGGQQVYISTLKGSNVLWVFRNRTRQKKS
jgi:hypothetical protein